MGDLAPSRDQFGFWWWLAWILAAILALIGSALFWTWSIPRWLGSLDRPPVMMVWIVSVFGTWMVLVIPFIRAKERVMSHMDEEDEATVSWWLRWMIWVVAGLGVSAALWTRFLGAHFEAMGPGRGTLLWMAAVLGSWAIVLIPFTALARRKLTQAREDVRRQKEEKETATQIWVEESKRILHDSLTQKLRKIPPTLRGAHLLRATLRDGRRIETLVVSQCREVVGVYKAQEWPFEAKDIVELEALSRAEIERLDPDGWFWIDKLPGQVPGR